MILPDKKLDWPIAYEAVLEIARSEGCKLKAYLRNVFPRNTSRNFANGFWADNKFELAVFNLFPTFHDLTPTVVVNRPYHAGHRYAIC